MSRGRLLLALGLLGSLAIGLIAYEPPDPGPFAAADCFHVAADGTARSCEGPARPPSPTAAVIAAHWGWWAPAAAPIAFGLLAFTLWLRLRRRSGDGYSDASPVPPRP